MAIPKSIQIMKSFSKDEIREFSRFVDSPFFNRLSDVKRLFKLLKKFHPEFDPKLTDNKSVHKKLYPSKSYNDARIRNLYSDLGQLAEKFIVYKSLREESIYNDFLYLNHLLRRKLYSLFEKHYKLVKSKKEIQILDTNLRDYLLAMVRYNYLLEINKQHESGEIAYEKFDSLVEFFLFNLVRGLYDIKVHKNMHAFEKTGSLTNSFSESFDFEKFIRHINSAGKSGVIIELTYHMFSLLKGKNFDGHFNSLFELIDRHESELSHQIKYDVFLNLMNMLAFKIYEEGLNYYSYRLKVIKEVISRKLYHFDKNLTALPLILFITGVNLSVMLKDQEYLNFIMNSCLNLLPADTRHDALNYIQAKLEFQKKNYRKSLDYIGNINYKITPLRKHVKNLTLILYYELGYFDSAESLLVSYKQYLNRNNGFTGMYGEWYDNFLKSYGVLLKIDRRSKESVRKFRDKTEKTVKILFKSWFMQKADELIK